MAKRDASFNFGANARPKKGRSGGGKKGGKGGSNWQAYVGEKRKR